MPRQQQLPILIKYAFTALYASPEQWQYRRATPAADVYAFGVTAFELLQGHLPFAGPSFEDYREQHLNQAPPSLAGVTPSITALVSECLHKLPEVRPTPANILIRLRKSQQPFSPAAVNLQAVHQSIVEKQVQAGAM
jgi:serine/threonine-protein kinase